MSDALNYVGLYPIAAGDVTSTALTGFVMVDTATDCVFGPALHADRETAEAWLRTLGPDPRYVARHLLQESWAHFRASKETP